jgi:hypothetical protein
MSTTATYTCAVAATPEETLAEEARRRTKAGATAIAAGVLTLIGSAVLLAATRDFPTAGLIETLRARFGEGPASGPGLLARKVLFFDDHAALSVASHVVPALATALVGVALTFLYRSTKARDPQMSMFAVAAAIAGAAFVLVPALVAAVSLTLDAHAFAGAADQGERAAREVLDAPLRSTTNYLQVFGTASIGLGFVLTALNAMRVGLLTRFMGVLGIIVGGLFLVPLEGQLPFVKIFWLLALGALFLGRWPGGVPPAWVTGEAQPWPTQQEIREQRTASQAERGGGGLEQEVRRPRRGRAEPPETPAPAPPPSKPHSSSKKKKRKRR